MKLPTLQDMRTAYKPLKLKFVSFNSFALGWKMCRTWFKKYGESPPDYMRQVVKPYKTPFK